MSTKSPKIGKMSRDIALRDLEYATSLAIQLLSELDRARAQIRILNAGEDGLGCPPFFGPPQMGDR